MLHLIRLEMKKYRLQRYIKGCIIANLCLFGLMFLVTSDKTAPLDYYDFQNMADVFIRGVFLVYSSCLMGTIVIAEYRDQLILQTFSYPISRKKIITAKLLIVSGFVLINIVISKILIFGGFYMINQFGERVIGGSDLQLVLRGLPMMGLGLFSTAFLALIPFMFGMRKHSIQMTIGTSVLVSVAICTYNSGMTMTDLIIKEVICCLAGIVSTIYTFTTKINRLEEADV